MRHSNDAQARGFGFLAAAIFDGSRGPSAPNAPGRRPDPTGTTGSRRVYGDAPGRPGRVHLDGRPHQGAAAASGAPTLVWEALEHGEKVECLDCIAVVAPLLYDCERQEPRDRGVVAAAPHLRRVRPRRGLSADDADARRRLEPGASRLRRLRARRVPRGARRRGVRDGRDERHRPGRASRRGQRARPLERRRRRRACDRARRRDPSVRLAALESAVAINSFSSVGARRARSTTDGTAEVRRSAIEVLDGTCASERWLRWRQPRQHDADPACPRGSRAMRSAHSATRRVHDGPPDSRTERSRHLRARPGANRAAKAVDLPVV